MSINKITISKIQRFIADNAILFIWGLLFLIAVVGIKGFASGYNIKSYLVNCAVLLIAACGLTFPLLNGGIDFSITSVVSLVSTISAYIMVSTSIAGTVLGVPVAIVVSIFIGVIIGGINGIAVSKLKMPSFVVTLSTMLIFSGVAIWFGSIFYEKVSLSGLPKSFTAIGGRGAFWILPVVIAVIIFVITHLLISSTVFGRRLYAIGVNPKTAAISGVPVKKTIFTIFVISGVLGSIAGLVFTAKNGAGVVSLGDQMFINFVGAVVIGGTSPMGGFGGIKNTLYGVLLIMLISNLLNLLGVDYTLYDVIKGTFILFAAALELFTRRMKEKASILVSKKDEERVTN